MDYDRDGDLDIFVANAAKTTAPTVLYRNDGSGNFTDVAIQSAVALTSGVESAAWADYDGDGYTDFMMTELGGAGGIGYRLYRNLGDGTFTQTTTTAGFSQGHWPNSVAWGDYDNDGDLDIFFSRGYPAIQDSLIWNTNTITAIISPPSTGQEGLIFTTTTPTASFDLWKTDRRQYRSEVTLGNTNQRPPAVPFTLDDATAHFGQPTSTSGITFVWRDDPTTPGTFAGRGRRWPVTNWSALSLPPASSPKLFQSASIFHPPSLMPTITRFIATTAMARFQQVSSAAGMSDRFANTQQAQWVDVDNDGDLDLYATNMGNTYSGNEPNRLYRNNGNAPLPIWRRRPD
ncbi:MAG: VCBS repeat-containing protein [Anaerolineales bacterium]|nr:VCBS repeat-containing protein [Anaerolineales bacterium]